MSEEGLMRGEIQPYSTMLLSEIALSGDVQTREINTKQVSRLVEALKSGAQLPPMLVSEEEHLLLGGYHRYAAYLRMHGESHRVQVRYVSAPSILDAFEWALRDNAKHGTPLKESEQKAGVAKVFRLGLGVKDIANALNVTLRKAEVLLAAAAREAKHEEVKPKPKPRTDKRGVLESANYLLDRIRNDLVDFSDAQTRVTLRELYKLLKMML